MNNLSSILFVAIAVAIAGLAYLWRRLSALEGQLREERKNLAAQTSERERAAQQAKKKAGELEQTKKQLHETRAKMKRLQKESHSPGGKRARSADSEQTASASTTDSSVSAVVHVSNQELETRHAEKLAKMEADLHKERVRVRKLEEAATRRKKEEEQARKALQGDTPPEGTAEEQLRALEQRFEAFRKETTEETRKLKKAASRAEAKERAALRRANNNHSLYLVIKGQLELAEDKVALFRRRYEGAKSPVHVRAESDSDNTEPATSAPPEAANTAAADPSTDAPAAASDTGESSPAAKEPAEA